MKRSSEIGTKILPLRERLKGETQREILHAAEAVFGQSGLNGARMEDIAARAGVSVGTLYNHFEDRDALLSALVVSRREDLLNRLDEVLAAHDKEPFGGQLEHFVRAVLEHFDSHKAFLAILLESEHARAHAPVGPRASRPNTALLQVYRRGGGRLLPRVAAGAPRPGGAGPFPPLLFGLPKRALSPGPYAPTRGPPPH